MRDTGGIVPLKIVPEPANSSAAQRQPRLIRTPAELRAALAEQTDVGLVPTMGALHEGHAHLIQRARQESRVVVLSVFVNPLQFGPNEDYERYPRVLDSDLELAEREGVNLVFAPEPEDMYPPGFATRVSVPPLADVLDGAARPGHFTGVATVVLKLLNLVRPDRAYFGEKDWQQLTIIRRMVSDLNVTVDIVGVPTVRSETPGEVGAGAEQPQHLPGAGSAQPGRRPAPGAGGRAAALQRRGTPSRRVAQSGPQRAGRRERFDTRIPDLSGR